TRLRPLGPAVSAGAEAPADRSQRERFFRNVLAGLPGQRRGRIYEVESGLRKAGARGPNNVARNSAASRTLLRFAPRDLQLVRDVVERQSAKSSRGAAYPA